MANKLVQTCDQCATEIEEYQTSKSIAFNNGARLSFHTWSDSLAAEKTTIHFHSDLCARNYLEDWLRKQRQDASKRDAEAKQPTRVSGWVEEAPAPAFQRLEEAAPEPVTAAPVQELDSPAVEAALARPLSPEEAAQQAAEEGIPF